MMYLSRRETVLKADMIEKKIDNGDDFEEKDEGGGADSAESATFMFVRNRMLEDKYGSNPISGNFVHKGVYVPNSGPSKRANGNEVARENNFITTPHSHVHVFP